MTTKKYCPSNGTEGMYFQDSFCFQCRFYDEEKGCPILNATMRLDVKSDEYPDQWVTKDNHLNPECTAFEPAGEDTSKAFRVLCKADRL